MDTTGERTTSHLRARKVRHAGIAVSVVAALALFTAGCSSNPIEEAQDEVQDALSQLELDEAFKDALTEEPDPAASPPDTSDGGDDGVGLEGDIAQMPADFPQEIPLYPGGTLILGANSLPDGSTGWVLSYEVSDAATVFADATALMDAEDYDAKVVSDQTGMRVKVYYNGALAVQLMVMGEGSLATLTYTVTEDSGFDLDSVDEL